MFDTLKRRAVPVLAAGLTVVALTAMPVAMASPSKPATTGHVTQGGASTSFSAAFPNVSVLYNQDNNLGTNATSSQNFEASLDAYDDFTADDFVVPTGRTWRVQIVVANGTYAGFPGPVQSFNVAIYADSGGLPGAVVASAPNSPYRTGTPTASDFDIQLSTPAILQAGTYWVSVQANMDFGTGGQWYWTDRTVLSNSAAAWQDPGGGFGICPSWGTRNTTCAIDPGVPDQGFVIAGAQR